MENISYLQDLLNTFGKYSFLYTTFVEPLIMMKSVPDNISTILNNPDFLLSLQEASSSLEKVIKFISDNKKLINKEITSFKPSKADFPYADFSIDEPPIINDIDRVKRSNISYGSCSELISKGGIKPINRRSDSTFIFKGNCPFCGASHDYIYDNNSKGQYLCKVCNNTFKENTNSLINSPQTAFYCPHGKCKLELHHDRDGYKVFYCNNKKCSFYTKNKAESLLNPDKFKTSSNGIKLRYHFREFKFSLKDLDEYYKTSDSKVNLAKIYSDEYTLGLVLTYRINYGLSARKTSAIMQEVHGFKISHQTIMNYTSAAASILKPYVDSYPYKLGDSLTGDETYVKVKGKNHYIFFFSDPEKKIITSYNIFERRTTVEACKAIYSSLCKYSPIPQDLLIVTDANPIYNAAQVFFKLNNKPFNLKQVTGLSNNNFDSWFFRPYKQIEERLNRTFKSSYSGMNGFSNLKRANEYMVLFVAYFNFLRKHKGLNDHCPVEDNLFEGITLMPLKWLKLIEYPQKLAS